MKIPARKIYPGAWLALFLAWTVAVTAQEPAAPPAPPASATESTDQAELRRLDVEPAEADDAGETASTAVPEEKSATSAEAAEPTVEESQVTETSPAAPEAEEEAPRDRKARHRRDHDSQRVAIGHNAQLEAGETADAVVSIFGSSTSAGTVRDAVVSVLGSSTSSGRVSQAVVSVLGNSRVTAGYVGQDVVSVLGNTYVNGEVRGGVVTVLGNVELGPKAVVHGEIVTVGGTIKRDPLAVVHGQIENVAFMGGNFNGLEWLQVWITKCLFLGRPLAFDARVLWAWWIALAFLALYVVLALIAAKPVEKCAQTLEERPGYSILTAVLAVLLAPVVFVLLCVTLVGIAVVPFLGAALFFATIFGKVVMLAWIGRRLSSLWDQGRKSHAALATLIGGVVVLGFYTVPVIGIIVYKVLGVLGLGVVLYTLILSTNRKSAAAGAATAGVTAPGAATPVPTSTPTASAAVATPPVVVDVNGVPVTPVEPAPAPAPSAATPPVMTPPPSVLVSAATLPRAGFWIRFAASLIDAMLVAITLSLFPSGWEPNFLLGYAAYCAVLWALKATTVGGIVCSLKVVRLDDRPLDWTVALVRALGGFLSFLPAGLGFIWVIFDDQRQSWHDKIAGTTVVHVPRGVSLV